MKNNLNEAEPLEGSQTSPHRFKLREATSDKPLYRLAALSQCLTGGSRERLHASPHSIGSVIREHSCPFAVEIRTLSRRRLGDGAHFAVEICQNCPMITASPENAGIA